MGRSSKRHVGGAAGILPVSGAYASANQIAPMWSPYLTMTEGIKIACWSYSTGRLHALLLRHLTLQVRAG